MMPQSVTTIEGDVMAWYEIINAKSESYIADRDAEDLLRQLATALQTEDGPAEAEVLYGLTSNPTLTAASTFEPVRKNRPD
jgi:hypothetical protein